MRGEPLEDFFTGAGPIAGVHPTPVRGKEHVYRVGKIPKTLSSIAERLERHVRTETVGVQVDRRARRLERGEQ